MSKTPNSEKRESTFLVRFPDAPTWPERKQTHVSGPKPQPWQRTNTTFLLFCPMWKEGLPPRAQGAWGGGLGQCHCMQAALKKNMFTLNQMDRLNRLYVCMCVCVRVSAGMRSHVRVCVCVCACKSLHIQSDRMLHGTDQKKQKTVAREVTKTVQWEQIAVDAHGVQAKDIYQNLLAEPQVSPVHALQKVSG